jgi:hypothetical protein
MPSLKMKGVVQAIFCLRGAKYSGLMGAAMVPESG